MSLAWKCDVCGAFYESDIIGYTNFIKLGLINNSGSTNGCSKFFHICPSCKLVIKKVLDDLNKEVKDGN